MRQEKATPMYNALQKTEGPQLFTRNWHTLYPAIPQSFVDSQSRLITRREEIGAKFVQMTGESIVDT